ncbi:MAG: hypothetical protein PHW33_04100, partial [Candidatus Portnoybacteria bacterium]|nr:hypothetical protein [Candidatus Portnoybacteria bacterium]
MMNLLERIRPYFRLSILLIPFLTFAGCGSSLDSPVALDNYKQPLQIGNDQTNSTMPSIEQQPTMDTQNQEEKDKACTEQVGPSRYIQNPPSLGGGAYCDCNEGYTWDVKTLHCLPKDNDGSQIVGTYDNSTNKGNGECTSFEYSRWNNCSVDGTQYRLITKTYPTDNCSGGNPVQQRTCEYTLTDFGTAEDLFKKMENQLLSDPGHLVSMEYRTGEDNKDIANTEWFITKDGYYSIRHVIKNASGQIANIVQMWDTNGDFRPEFLSANNGPMQKMDMSQPS